MKVITILKKGAQLLKYVVEENQSFALQAFCCELLVLEIFSLLESKLSTRF